MQLIMILICDSELPGQEGNDYRQVAKINSPGRIVHFRSEKDYEETLARIDPLMHAVPDSPEFEEMDVLVDLTN